MSNRHVRTRHLVDGKVQGAVLRQIARYWLYSVSMVGMLTLLGWLFVSPGIDGLVNLRHQMPAVMGGLFVAIMAALLVLPLILLDMVRFTNRFAGPMHRLHRAMAQAAEGETVEPVHLRDGDFWKEYADTFNRLVVRLERLQQSGTTTKDRETAGPVPQELAEQAVYTP